VSHKQIQRRAEEAVARNAGQVAEAAGKTAATFRPRVVVLAGEVQGRTAVREQLPDELDNFVVDTERGGGDRHTQDASLAEHLPRIASDVHNQDTEYYSEAFGTRQAQGLATQGGQNTAAAGELGAIETLLFEDGAPASREELLIQAGADTDASVELLPTGADLADGAGALLRFPLRS
jgi:stalled ribosome rescue protein Dom34